MALNTWTHPKHDVVAGISLLINIVAIVILFFAIGTEPWYIDKRARLFRKFVDGEKDDKSHKIYENNVNCENDVCRFSNSGQATWQVIAFFLMIAGTGLNALSVMIQLLIFWPLACNGKVVNALLRICITLDILGAPCKFFCGFIFIYHSPKINDNYAWRKEEDALQLEPLPLGLILFSYILQTLAYMLLIIATDKGPRGGPTHLERLELEEDMVIKAQEELEARSRSQSIYMPDSTDTRSRTLSQVLASAS